MPAIDNILAVTTAVFAVAAWVVPPVHYLLSFRSKPRDSLAVVGRVIGLIVLAAILSVVTLLLAVLTLTFTLHTGWGWFGLGAIALYWLAFAAFLLLTDNAGRRREIGRKP